MNKEELKQYIIDNNYLNETLLINILNYAEGLDEVEQYKFLEIILPIPEIILRNIQW